MLHHEFCCMYVCHWYQSCTTQLRAGKLDIAAFLPLENKNIAHESVMIEFKRCSTKLNEFNRDRNLSSSTPYTVRPPRQQFV